MAPLAHDGTFTTSDGVTIAFTRRAAPHADAPRMVLIHSLALDRRVWDGVAEAMKNDKATTKRRRRSTLPTNTKEDKG